MIYAVPSLISKMSTFCWRVRDLHFFFGFGDLLLVPDADIGCFSPMWCNMLLLAVPVYIQWEQGGCCAASWWWPTRLLTESLNIQELSDWTLGPQPSGHADLNRRIKPFQSKTGNAFEECPAPKAFLPKVPKISLFWTLWSSICLMNRLLGIQVTYQ